VWMVTGAYVLHELVSCSRGIGVLSTAPRNRTIQVALRMASSPVCLTLRGSSEIRAQTTLLVHTWSTAL
jgi:hypothetical protein